MVSCARDGQVRLAELSSIGICKNTKKLAQHRGAAHKVSILTGNTQAPHYNLIKSYQHMSLQTVLSIETHISTGGSTN